MLRKIALFLLPIALLAAACGGSTNDSAVGDTGDEPVEAASDSSDAGPDGIYGTADDGGAGDAGQPDQPNVGIDPDVGIDPEDPGESTGNSRNGPGNFSPESDFVSSDGNEPDDGFGSFGDSRSLDDNTVFGALNPFSFLGGTSLPPGSQAVDPELGSVLLSESDVPANFEYAGEFSFTGPSSDDLGEVTMASRMFSTTDDPNEFGAMIISMVMTASEAEAGDLADNLTPSDAYLAELEELGRGNFYVLNTDGLGESGFGMHTEIDFAGMLSAMGIPDDGLFPAGIGIDTYIFAVGNRILMLAVMSPIGEPPAVDGRSLAEIMAARA